jgi:hypothetical protein
MSSGKIATYLRHGLPVVTNATGEIADLIRKYNAGFVVSSPSDAVSKLDDVSPCQRDGARTLFKERIDFDLYSEKIYQEMARTFVFD